MICSNCGQECDVRYIDTGVGSNEFWGEPGYDEHSEYLSDCCNAQPLDGDGSEILDKQSFFEDDGDYEYDLWKENQHYKDIEAYEEYKEQFSEDEK